MSFKTGWKFVISRVLLLCLIFTFPVPIASAAESAQTPTLIQLQNQAANRMVYFKIVSGFGNGELGLNNNITRAQLVTLLVRAFGQDANAKLLQGAPTGFEDITPSDAWATGYIALAKNLVERNGGGKIGISDVTFAPNANMTPAEGVVFLMKFLGVQPDPAKSWPDNYLDVAVEKGLITADDRDLIALMSNSAATRGLAFYLLDRSFSASSPLFPGNKSFYQTFVDRTPPEIFVYVPTETLEPSLTVIGSVRGDASEVRVNTAPVTLSADGTFSYVVPMMVGKENTIQVWAKDLAGNETTKTVVVKHLYGDPASIEAADLTVSAGESIDVGAVVKDQYGNTIPETPIVVESSLGTYMNGKFTAAQKAGSGTATLKAWSSGKEIVKTIKVTVVAANLAKVEADKTSAALGESVQLKAMDKYGNVINNGVAWSQSSPDAKVDAATGLFVANKPGSYSVTAKKGDKSVTGTIAVYGLAARVLVDVPKSLEEGQSGTITVKVVDVFGNIIPNFNGTVHVLNAGNGVNVTVGEIRNGVASGTVSAVYSGTFTLDFQIMVKSETQSITVTPRPAPVYIPPANHAPVWLSNISDRFGEEPLVLNSLVVFDPDGDSLTFMITRPDGSELDESDGFYIHEDEDLIVIDGVVPEEYSIIITAHDGKTSSSSNEFKWTIPSPHLPQ